MKRVNFNVLQGKTLSKIESNGLDEILFYTTENQIYKMFHDQDCCESVSIDDICGEFDDLIGSPILIAREDTNDNINPPNIKQPEKQDDDFCWTFYNISTIKGTVTIRWYGESNGYYSISVDFFEVNENEIKRLDVLSVLWQ